MTKKWPVVLFAVLFASLCCGSVGEICDMEEHMVSGDFEYVLREDGTAEIVSWQGTGEDVQIPEQLSDWKVTALGEAAFSYSSCHSLIIPETVSFIDAYAFSGSDIHTVVFTGTGPVELEGNPFADADVEHFEVSADHANLTVNDGVLFDNTEMRLICWPKCRTERCYEIPNGTRIVGKHAFYASPLQEIIMPQTLELIDDYAFKCCNNLEELIITSSEPLSIGTEAFQECRSLESIYLSGGLTCIGDSCFRYCSNLKEIRLGENVSEIGMHAFSDCRSLEEISLPASVSQIGAYVFMNCDVLRTIAIAPGNLRYEVYDGALYDLHEKRLIAYPHGRESESLTIRDGTVSIDNQVCQFSGIQEVVIPESCRIIGKWAFDSIDVYTLPQNILIDGGEPVRNDNAIMQNGEATGKGSFRDVRDAFSVETDILPGFGNLTVSGMWAKMSEIAANADRIVAEAVDPDHLSDMDFLPEKASFLPIRLNIEEMLEFREIMLGLQADVPERIRERQGDWLFIAMYVRKGDRLDIDGIDSEYREANVCLCTVGEYLTNLHKLKGLYDIHKLWMLRPGMLCWLDGEGKSFVLSLANTGVLPERSTVAWSEQPETFTGWKYYEDTDGSSNLYWCFSPKGGNSLYGGSYVMNEDLSDGIISETDSFRSWWNNDED